MALTCVRFAPSPTGHLHIGGVRTALFNYLYARSQNGRFLLRIEDTDRERSRKEFENEILDSLCWLGLVWNGEIVRQSERLERYHRAARELVSRGAGYEDRSEGKSAIRFKMPCGEKVFKDLIHGEVRFDMSLFDDLVILKSDGYPTYHWACVVDDHDFEITHVIRGDDHLSNTPRQLALFEAMGWSPPRYAHLPLILGDDGTPLSKRHGAVALSAFRERGFLPEGILNYLVLLGWGPDDNQEFLKLEDLVKKFSLKRVNKSGTRFDMQKLEFINAQHIKGLPEGVYLERITSFYRDVACNLPPEKWKRLVLLYRNRIRTFADLREQASYVFSEIEVYEPQKYNEFFQNRALKAHLEAWIEKASGLESFEDVVAVEKMTRAVAEGWGVEAKDLIHPLRFALTGKTVSPGLFDVMCLLGKDTCIRRVKRFLAKTD